MRKPVQNSLRKSFSLIGCTIKHVYGKPKVVDTNVLVNDARSIDNLEDHGTNSVIVPWIVLSELDVLKNNQDLSRQIGEVVRVINRKIHEKDPTFNIVQVNMKDYPSLDNQNPDHHIIATCLQLKREHPDIDLTLVSNDAMVHAFGSLLGITVEEYKADQVNRVDFEKSLPRIFLDDLEYCGDESFQIKGGLAEKVLSNSGAVISDREGEVIFPAIRKGDLFIPISPEISAMGIAPFSINGEPNWAQCVALQQLLDPSIPLITLHGPAGTGKTLLSIAAAICQLKTVDDGINVEVVSKKKAKAGNNQLQEVLNAAKFARKRYRKIYIARPFIHLSGKDPIGYFPGSIEAKSAPWLAPIYDNIDFIASRSEHNSRIIKEISQNRDYLEILSLSLIRGRTITEAFVIIDEAQNLTRSEMKTIVTRVGEDTKLVLSGDINQMDVRWIDKLSSGMTHVTVKMSHVPYFGNTYLDMSVRSKIAKDAAELL